MADRKTSKRSKAKTILRLADLEQSKNAVLHSLGAASSQESYGHAIDEFIGWYCSEPRLAFNLAAVLCKAMMICIDGFGDDGSISGHKALHSFTDSLPRTGFKKAISITELRT